MLFHQLVFDSTMTSRNKAVYYDSQNKSVPISHCHQTEIVQPQILSVLQYWFRIDHFIRHLGWVVQSIVSLTSSLSGQLVKCLMTI